MKGLFWTASLLNAQIDAEVANFFQDHTQLHSFLTFFNVEKREKSTQYADIWDCERKQIKQEETELVHLENSIRSALQRNIKISKFFSFDRIRRSQG